MYTQSQFRHVYMNMGDVWCDLRPVRTDAFIDPDNEIVWTSL